MEGGRGIQPSGEKNQGFFAHPPAPRLLYKNKEAGSNERRELIVLEGRAAAEIEGPVPSFPVKPIKALPKRVFSCHIKTLPKPRIV